MNKYGIKPLLGISSCAQLREVYSRKAKRNVAFKVVTAVAAAAMLAGCAPSQLSSFLPSGFNSNQSQSPARVMPGVVVSVAPAGDVGGGLFSGTKPGEDIIVKTDTMPPQMLSIIQQIQSGQAAFTTGEHVGVVYSNTGNGTRVIPLPNATANRFPVPTAEQHTMPPISHVQMSLNPPSN
ncbi:MAG: hypothetical protein M0Z50_09865 [Planctomycetia bacterium]|nr:hypothetical protein [Planctomycetia bacterium]